MTYFKRPALFILLLLFFCLSTFTDCRAETDLKRPRVGVKLNKFEHELEVVAEELKSAGVNIVFAGRRVINDNNFDRFLDLCHEREIEVFAIFPVFNNSKAIKQDPSLAQIDALGNPTHSEHRRWYRFVCPNRQDYRQKKIAEFRDFLIKHKVDGLSLDFIRYGVEWEMIKPEDKPGFEQEYCFCPVCLEKFKKLYQLPEGKNTIELARFILKNHREDWTRLKCQSITSMVKEIRQAVREVRPGTKIAVHALPWTEEDYDDGACRLGGQDFKALSQYVDIMSPMSYHYMLYRDAGSIHKVVVYISSQDCYVMPCIQAEVIFRKEDIYSAEEFQKAIRQALLAPSSGINLYTWVELKKRPDCKKIWIEKLGERHNQRR